jgi:hypothetical protein
MQKRRRLDPLVGVFVRLVILQEVVHEVIILGAFKAGTSGTTGELITTGGSCGSTIVSSWVSTETTVSAKAAGSKVVTTSGSKVASREGVIAPRSFRGSITTAASTIATTVTATVTAATSVATVTAATTSIATTTSKTTITEAASPLSGRTNPYVASM